MLKLHTEGMTTRLIDDGKGEPMSPEMRADLQERMRRVWLRVNLNQTESRDQIADIIQQ